MFILYLAIVAFGIFAVTIFAGIIALFKEFSTPPDRNFWIIIPTFGFVAFIVGISLFATSESIMVFIDMADNLSKIKEGMGEDLSEIKRRLADKSD